MHIRAEIRHLIKARLIAADIVGSRVYAARHRPVNKDIFPAILIFAELDAAGKSQTADELGDIDQAVAPRSRNLLTVISVGVDASVAGEETVDDTLDDLTAEVERVMIGDRVSDWGLMTSEFVYEVTYVRTELKELPGGERIVLSALMYFDIQYRGQA